MSSMFDKGRDFRVRFSKLFDRNAYPSRPRGSITHSRRVSAKFQETLNHVCSLLSDCIDERHIATPRAWRLTLARPPTSSLTMTRLLRRTASFKGDLGGCPKSLGSQFACNRLSKMHGMPVLCGVSCDMGLFWIDKTNGLTVVRP